MINTRKVTLFSQDCKNIKHIMKTSFPKGERMFVLSMWVTALLKQNHFVSLFDDNDFIGFTYYVEDDRYIAILYLAIVEELQGKGYGGSVIDSFLENHSKPLVLNVGIPSDSSQESNKKERLLSFYGRHGIIDTGYYFRYRETEYLVLSNGTDGFDKSAYEKLCFDASLGLAHYKLYKRSSTGHACDPRSASTQSGIFTRH